jgi:hypothetical protein
LLVVAALPRRLHGSHTVTCPGSRGWRCHRAFKGATARWRGRGTRVARVRTRCGGAAASLGSTCQLGDRASGHQMGGGANPTRRRGTSRANRAPITRARRSTAGAPRPAGACPNSLHTRAHTPRATTGPRGTALAPWRGRWSARAPTRAGSTGAKRGPMWHVAGANGVTTPPSPAAGVTPGTRVKMAKAGTPTLPCARHSPRGACRQWPRSSLIRGHKNTQKAHTPPRPHSHIDSTHADF